MKALKRKSKRPYVYATKPCVLPCPNRRPMDKAIEPLVAALNASGAFRTRASCGGHIPPPKRSLSKGRMAYVIFETRPLNAERWVEKLAVLLQHQLRDVPVPFYFGAQIGKNYWTESHGSGRPVVLHRDYSIEISPRITAVSDRTLRRDLDQGIALLLRVVLMFNKDYESALGSFQNKTS